MNTTIHEMTLANYKRSKTQQKETQKKREEENHQDREWSVAKKIQGIQCPRESIVARVSEKRESMNIGIRNVA